MSNKKSSFRMGNEFNGYGEMTYLKATEHKTYAPLSKKNVRMTPDFSSLLPKMLGIVSVVIDSKSLENNIVVKSLGGAAISNQVILKKEESSGEYIAQVQVANLGLMTGSYLQSRTSGNERINVNPGIQPGWEKQANGGWKYINESGAYIQSDWKQHKGKWYYLNSDEYMVTDWKKISRKWYYFKPGQDNGYMVLGWRKIKDKWYYFKEEDEAGYMALGWRKIKDKWYYFKEEDEAGYMALGWREIKGKWYYLKEDGSMAVNETITDPDSEKTYHADKDGVCKEISANTSMPFANMTLQQKEQLIYQFDYSTEKKADEHIVTITVPIWVFEENDPTKRKISKNRKVRVNELVADDVINIFEKIYNDSEQFPIYYSPELKYYQVEGYHYRNSRGSNKPSMHSYGAAIDINSSYNQYKIIPAASPFKVESSGSVVRVFSEHGWYWGGEFSQKSVDYMHFSLIEKGANSRLKK